MIKHYTFISRERTGNICNYMLADLQQCKNVRFVYQFSPTVRLNGRLLRKMQSRYLRLNWEVRKRLLLYKWRRYAAGTHAVVVTNEAMILLQPKDLQKLQDAGTPVIALLIDPISKDYPSAAAARELLSRFSFHKVITFDPVDAKQNNWCYCNTLYSRFPVTPQPLTNDLFYIGNLKNRLSFCQALLEKMAQNSVNSFIKLACDPESAKILPPETVLNAYLPYPQMLQLLQSTKCILDVTQEGQTGVTLRYYEAVAFNKKLLTNNRSIAQLPFYDPRYMKFYDTVEDMDWQWVKSDDMPDYKYDDRFSSIHLLDLMN